MRVPLVKAHWRMPTVWKIREDKMSLSSLVPSLLLKTTSESAWLYFLGIHLVAGWLHRATYIKNVQHCVLTGIDSYARYNFAFPAYSAFSICGCGKCLVHHMAFHAILFVTKKLILQWKSVGALSYPQESLALFHTPSHRSIWFSRRVAWLSKD